MACSTVASAVTNHHLLIWFTHLTQANPSRFALDIWLNAIALSQKQTAITFSKRGKSSKWSFLYMVKHMKVLLDMNWQVDVKQCSFPFLHNHLLTSLQIGVHVFSIAYSCSMSKHTFLTYLCFKFYLSSVIDIELLIVCSIHWHPTLAELKTVQGFRKRDWQ